MDAGTEVQPPDDPGAGNEAGEVLADQGVGGSSRRSGKINNSVGRDGLATPTTTDR